jgi:putative transposase
LIRTYKFRLYPNHEQSKKLDNNLAVCKWVYNKMVETIHENGSTSRNDLNYFLTELKQQQVWLKSYHSKMLQMISTQVDGAQKALKQLQKNGKKTGDLKFRKFGEYRTFTYNQSGYHIETHGDKTLLWLSKINYVETRQHRPILGQIKQVTVTKSKSGKWHCSITCDVKQGIVPAIDYSKVVGIDVGIINFVYDSDGEKTENPLSLKKMLRPLAKTQRKIARRQKDSNNRKKAIKWYQIIHERIKNKRKNFLHNISTKYAKKYSVVFVEDLKIQNMVKNHKLARSILDSGWGTFKEMLDYKCKMVEVPARNTSIECSECGNMVPKTLAVRIHRCDMCGLVLDRDHNSAIDIKKKGLEIINIKLPQELRECTPVEIPMGSLKQENAVMAT